MVPLLLAAICSVILGFLFAAAESATSRIGRHLAESLVEDERRGAPALLTLVGDSGAVAMVLTFLRVIAEATAAVLVTLAVNGMIDGFWRVLFLSIAIMAVVSFVLVGVSPRTLGRHHAVSFALAAAPTVLWLRKVLGPVAQALVATGNAVTPGGGYKEGPFDSEAELREYVDMATDSELIEAEESKMIHSVFELGDTIVREVMVPRTDMVTIEEHKTLRQATKLFIRSGFSRVPVVGDGPDDVVGLLYLKDVVARGLGTDVADNRPVAEVMRDVDFVPESKPADDLLREMQQVRRHFAVIIDEYGGTAGLVTLEDIIEEVVGEIDDEYDRVTPGPEKLLGGQWRVPARMSVDDLAEHFDVDIDDDDVDTVGGLLSKLVGRVPIPGATAQIGGLRLTAERMAGRRHQIATLLVEQVDHARQDDPHTADSDEDGADRPVTGETAVASGHPAHGHVASKEKT